MKKLNPISFLGLALAFVFSTSLIAQDKTEVSVQIKKEGKAIMDTTYQYRDDAEAKHAVKMMEWITEEELDGDNVKVIKKKIEAGEHPHEEHMVIVKVGEGETYDFFIDEDHEVGDDVEIEVKEIIEEHGDGENVEVIVIKKKTKKKPKEQ